MAVLWCVLSCHRAQTGQRRAAMKVGLVRACVRALCVWQLCKTVDDLDGLCMERESCELNYMVLVCINGSARAEERYVQRGVCMTED
jgi:hypothetical protein